MKEKTTEYEGKKPVRGKGKIAVTAICCTLAALLLFSAGWVAHWFSLGKRARSLLWAVDTADKNYYRDVDEDALYDKFFDALSLDQYSTYYTAEEYRALLRSNAGEGAGTGVSLSAIENNGMSRILRVDGNSPAERAGLGEGMYIYAYGASEDALTEGTASQCLQFMNKQTSPFVLRCGYREDGADAALYTVAPGAYTVSECLYADSLGAVRFVQGEGMVETDHAYTMPEDTAYLRLDEFYGAAVWETGQCLGRMREHGKTRLILDLRHNGGGYLDVFCGISSYFLKDTKDARPLVATARYKSGKVEKFYAPSNLYADYFPENAEIFVLADEYTASASECLLGALVSYGAVPYSHIFLRKAESGAAKTYGKGIMQSHYEDYFGNVLKLTSAEIFWPDGKSIHGVGLTEADGAVGIPSTVLHGAEDGFLAAVLAKIAS